MVFTAIATKLPPGLQPKQFLRKTVTLEVIDSKFAKRIYSTEAREILK